jgi:hypothetical protein
LLADSPTCDAPTAIHQMSVDLLVRDLARLSRTLIGRLPHSRVAEKADQAR